MTASVNSSEDELIILDNGADRRKLISEIPLSAFNNDSGFVTATLTDEQVQDKVGAMFSSNTETLITATYQDGDGTIDLVVDNDLSNYDNSSSGFITATLTTEQVQDIVGAMFSSNTETRISATYQDGDGTIDLVVDDMTADTNTNQLTTFTVSATTDSNATTISQGDDLMFAAGTGITCETTADGTVTITNTVTNTDTQLSTEQVQDIVGAMFTGNTETNTAVTYQDGDGTIDVVTTLDGAPLTTEAVQDIVGAMFTSNTETRIAATYEDGDGTIDLVVDDMTANTQLTSEEVQDIVGAMFTSNTETRISATYEDGDGTIDLVVDDMTTDTNTNQLTTFTLTADSGSNQVIAHGNTLDIAGSSPIVTAVGATDTVTISLDDPVNLTELNESTDATDDKILLWDESGSAWKYMTLDNLQDSIDTTGGGGGGSNYVTNDADDTMVGALTIDKNKSGSSTTLATGLTVDYDRTDTPSSGLDRNQGITLTMDLAGATGSGSQFATGIASVITFSAHGGSTVQASAGYFECTGADTGLNRGIGIKTGDDTSPDLIIYSPATALDYFQIATGTNGATTITTVEDGGDSNADLNLSIDGSMNFDVVGTVEFDGCGVGFDLVTPTYNASDTNVDFLTGNKQFVTFGAGNIADLNLIFPKTSGNFTLILKQDGSGSRTVTNYKVWDRTDSNAASGSATVLFAGGSNPTLTTAANKTDIISFFYDADNEIAYGVASLNF